MKKSILLKRVVSFLLVTAMMLFTASCSSKTDNKANGGNSQVKYDFENFDKSKFKDVTLNVYCVTDTVKDILEAFEKDTGIKSEYITLKNGEILQRLKNEKQAGKVIADVWFTGGADTFIEAAQSDILEKYDSYEGKNLGPDMKDKDGYWYGTSLTIVNFVVNTKLIKEKNLKIPETWDDLLDPNLKGEVSMSDPASSGTAYNILSAVLQTKGDTEGWEYIKKLGEQVPFFTPRGSDPASNVINGEAIVGINPSNGDRELEQKYDYIKLVYPKDGTGWWPQPAAIVKGTKNLEASKVFIEWLLSKKGMESVAKIRHASVSRDDVKIPEDVVKLNEVKLFKADFQEGAKNRPSVLEKWKEIIKK